MLPFSLFGGVCTITSRFLSGRRPRRDPRPDLRHFQHRNAWGGPIPPTVDEVSKAAYARWERRGWIHGSDRDDWLAAETELTFHAHCRTVLEVSLDGPERRVLARGPVRHCCFCERTASRADFGAPRPVI